MKFRIGTGNGGGAFVLDMELFSPSKERYVDNIMFATQINCHEN